jgi:hypothetical protein
MEVEMKITDAKGRNWIIDKGPSIWMTRNGKQDIRIKKQNAGHGMREEDGKLYVTAAVFAAESGEQIRGYEALPAEIALTLLRQWGFIEN